MTLIHFSTFAAPTEISNVPLNTTLTAKPNVIFALDDSGSMDFEVTFPTNEGGLWWEGISQSFADNNGKLHYNENSAFGWSDGKIWYLYGYLFPNGTQADARTRSDSSYFTYAIPPTPQFAFARCADYNALYYNPMVEYQPWSAAYINGALQTYSSENPANAKSHPVYTGPNGTRMNLGNNLFSISSNWTFRMFPGMQVPGADIPGIRRAAWGGWQNITSNTTVTSPFGWTVAIPYYPATYYIKDSTCFGGVNCAVAPDGENLRRIEIKPGNSFPSGRTYQQELRNFANWFTYYRKRKLALSASMGQTLSSITGIRGGMVRFNHLTSIAMRDFDSTNPAENASRLIGDIYQNPADYGTNTRAVLDYVGRQYQSDSSIVTKSCQFNSLMILTDGFATPLGPNTPSYDASKWGQGQPYTPIFTNSLADLALAYYTNNLRPDLPNGNLPVDLNSAEPNADKNPDLHMNTYAMTIGPVGTIYGTDQPEAEDPFANPPSWPNPNVSSSAKSIDDLWHATINGRGMMSHANNYKEILEAMRSMVYDVITRSYSNSGVAVEELYLRSGMNAVFAASHRVGSGELRKLEVDLLSGQVNSSAALWSAKDLLEQRTPESRILATYNGRYGIPFQHSVLPVPMRNQLTASGTDNMNSEVLVDWIRGDKTAPSDIYRQRSYRLGSMVHASPVVVGRPIRNYAEHGYHDFKTANAARTQMVYQAANDGMLHAFVGDTGEEAWAYIPGNSFLKLGSLAKLTFIHEYLLDATPTTGDVYFDGHWHTILVGGHGAGAKGYYALNITNPDVSSESELADKVLWEFPNKTTPTPVRNNIGYGFGRPKLIYTKAVGWVVVVTSGYNNTDGDGLGHLFILDPKTGALIKDISTKAGSSATPSGLAHISAYAENVVYDPNIDAIYGGDLEGNIWRFDLSGDDVSHWGVQKLATLTDANGLPQAVTSEPELGTFQDHRIIYLGTGRLLAENDLLSSSQQTIYALIDNGSANPLINPLRSQLTSLSDNTSSGKRGWFYDLQANSELITNNPIIVENQLLFNINKPSTDGCTSESYQYAFNINYDYLSQDEEEEEEIFEKITLNRSYLSKSLTTNPVVASLGDGKVIAITHNSDDTFVTTEIDISSPPVSKPVAWREIAR